MLLLFYSIYLFLGSVCLQVQGAPVTPAPGKGRQDAISSWTSSSSSSNPTFRNHGKFQKIHITNVNTNTNTNPNQHPNTHFISPSFLTNPNPNPPTSPRQSTIKPSPRLRQIYGIFINQARHLSSSASPHQVQQHSTLESSGWLPNKNQEEAEDTPTPDLLTQRRPLGIYALIRHLRRTDRVWAPVAILFAMSWLAVVAMGVVECIGVCWQRVMKRERQGRFGGGGGWGRHHERVLFDGGVLDEVIIEAVPMDDDDEDGDEQNHEDGGDRHKMLKKM
ncbi:uncharacterized protein LDX57_004032 [Aspergillus melleus]|uniref:uncharacterized protein n=1 Tax=Aspergillus melleus TaxID=138277 RepID=UPI001E8DCC66|nr:uncharacterized protein LDX57_004032 [Aspergillus melleus]KAH8426285.1 hypothetical protein LDX57_004032 [Aspergillus melleus]